MSNALHTIVIGGLNTDIVALGANKILSAGEYTLAKQLKIGPGGKSRNIAQMIAALSEKNTVAMIGKTSKDSYGLWKLPVQALKKAGVNIDAITITSFKETQQYPGIALIPVDKDGRNQIYVLPGITDSFSVEDIDKADEIFRSVRSNNGSVVLSLEFPLRTAVYAVKKANKLGIKVLLDPGGIEANKDYSELLKQNIFLIKPNEHEIKILTGVTVTNKVSAKKAADKLLQEGIENVFITLGKQGGYLVNKHVNEYIAVPSVVNSSFKDETGCGDQTMATICASLQNDDDVFKAASNGILAGTLQFGKEGIDPVTQEELNKFNR